MGKWTESPWQELPNVTMLNTKIVSRSKPQRKIEDAQIIMIIAQVITG
jgi:hypothetical protein